MNGEQGELGYPTVDTQPDVNLAPVITRRQAGRWILGFVTLTGLTTAGLAGVELVKTHPTDPLNEEQLYENYLVTIAPIIGKVKKIAEPSELDLSIAYQQKEGSDFTYPLTRLKVTQWQGQAVMSNGELSSHPQRIFELSEIPTEGPVAEMLESVGDVQTHYLETIFPNQRKQILGIPVAFHIDGSDGYNYGFLALRHFHKGQDNNALAF